MLLSKGHTKLYICYWKKILKQAPPKKQWQWKWGEKGAIVWKNWWLQSLGRTLWANVPMDIHPRTKCDTYIWPNRQDKIVRDSNHVVKSKQSVSPLKHKSENMILLGGKSYLHDPRKVNKGKNRKPHHISTPNKNHRGISYNPIFASTYNNPPTKSMSNYYNLAHYNNGLTTIQLPHLPQRNKLTTHG